MLILRCGFIVDVCLAMFPIVRSPLWLATLLHFARFGMCGWSGPSVLAGGSVLPM